MNRIMRNLLEMGPAAARRVFKFPKTGTSSFDTHIMALCNTGGWKCQKHTDGTQHHHRVAREALSALRRQA